MAVLAPRAFHMGGHWTPNMTWQGIGTMRDSTGPAVRPLRLLLSVYAIWPPQQHDPRGPGNADPAIPSARASVFVHSAGNTHPVRCGRRYLWSLDAESKQIDLSLSERTDGKRKRRFSLHGIFQGPSLPMDDHKSMFMYLPDGKLTPAVVHQPGT
jgi:hypothetical protein